MPGTLYGAGGASSAGGLVPRDSRGNDDARASVTRRLTTVRRLTCATIALFAASLTRTVATSQATAALPPPFETYLSTAVHPTSGERKSIRSGAAFTKLLDGDPSQEVIVFGAVWVNAPMNRYVEAVTDIENFERGGGFTITRRISSSPKLEDFAALSLPAETSRIYERAASVTAK